VQENRRRVRENRRRMQENPMRVRENRRRVQENRRRMRENRRRVQENQMGMRENRLDGRKPFLPTSLHCMVANDNPFLLNQLFILLRSNTFLNGALNIRNEKALLAGFSSILFFDKLIGAGRKGCPFF
jgi:hypothetical protein